MRPAIGDPPGMIGVAFADPRGSWRLAIPYYRVKVVYTSGATRELDLEAFISQWAKPVHACLTVDAPVASVPVAPEGYIALQPYGEAEAVISRLVSLVAELRKQAEREPAVRGAGRSIPGVLSRLFLGRRPATGPPVNVEVRLAYSLCADVFGDPPFSEARLMGGGLVWKTYTLHVVGDEVWLVRDWDGRRERRLGKILEDVEEAKKGLLEALPGATS